MTIGELVYKITGDNSGLKKSLNASDNAVKKSGKGMSALGKLATVAFAVVAVKAVAKLGKKLIGLASDAEETANKFGVVFDSVIGEANAMAEELSTNYGLARTESKKLLSDTGDLLVGFGVAKDKALDLSFSVQTLAVDLASFTNYAGGASGASTALTKALLGQTEMAQNLGLALGENDLRAYAEDQGLVFKELDRNEKMFLRLELAASQSGSAIGDFSRSIDSYANQMRIARARTQDLAEANSKDLLPLATLAVKAYNQLAESLIKSSQATSDFVRSSEGISKISAVVGVLVGVFQTLKAVFQIVVPAFKEVGVLLGSTIKNSVGELTTSLGGMSTAFTVLGVVIQTFVSVLKVLGNVFVAQITITVSFVKALIEAAKTMGEFFKAVKAGDFTQFNKQTRELKGSLFGIKDTAIKAAGDVIGSVKEVVTNFSSGAQDAANKTAKAFEEGSKAGQDAATSALTAVQAQAELGKQTEETEKKTKKSGKAVNSLKNEYKELKKEMSSVNAVLTLFSKYSAATVTGVTDMLSAYSGYIDAVLQKDLERLDEEQQNALERAGVAEDTAVETAEKELQIARDGGDAEAILEAENALKKAQIDEKFAKKKSETEYKAALAAWEIDKAIAGINLVAAPMNAYVSSLAAPWPLNMILAPINAALALGTASLQYAAVEKAKPNKPKFTMGGIVPGSSFAGDNVDISANSGEAVLTQRQQGQLLDIANGNQRGGGRPVVLPTIEDALAFLFEASRDGRLLIYEGSVVS